MSGSICNFTVGSPLLAGGLHRKYFSGGFRAEELELEKLKKRQVKRTTRLRGTGFSFIMALECLGGTGCATLMAEFKAGYTRIPTSENPFDNRSAQALPRAEDIVKGGNYSEEQLARLRLVLPIYTILADPNSSTEAMQNAIFELGELSKNEEDAEGLGASLKMAQLLRNIVRSRSPDKLREEAQVALVKIGLKRLPPIAVEERVSFDWTGLVTMLLLNLDTTVEDPYASPPLGAFEKRRDEPILPGPTF